MNIFQNKKLPQNKIISQFRAIKSIEDVADILNIDLNELLEIVEVDYKLQYKFFKIPKKDGSFRDLASPESNLKEIQRRLAYILEILYETNKREGINGFLKNRNIVKNAETHKKQEIIINIDIENFFPSITFTRVRGIFLGYYRFNIEISQFISRICCFPPETNLGLPQGAPTSPILSNIICISFDEEMQKFASENKFRYTRYADDITLSTYKKVISNEIAYLESSRSILGSKTVAIFQRNRFKINESKVRIQKVSGRQEVTGLIVNKKVNVRRSIILKIRSMLYWWSDKGIFSASEAFASDIQSENREIIFKSRVKGYISFLGQVRGTKDPSYVKYYLYLHRLDPKFASKTLNKIFQDTYENRHFLSLISNALKLILHKYGYGEKYFELLALDSRYKEVVQELWYYKYINVWNKVGEKLVPNRFGIYQSDANSEKTNLENQIEIFINFTIGFRNLIIEETTYKGGLMDYERGIKRLKRWSMSKSNINLSLNSDFLTLEDRLTDNLKQRRIHGSSENLRNDRSEIVKSLNEFCIEYFEVSFNSFCVKDEYENKYNILFFASSPVDQDNLRQDIEFRDLQNIINTSHNRQKIKLISVPAARISDLRKYLIDLQPNILHFSGHSDGKGIFLENENRESVEFSSKDLSIFLKNIPQNLDCLILNSCYSKDQIEDLKLYSKYTILVSTDIKDSASIEFSKLFYEALGGGLTIENCFDIAKNGITDKDLTDVFHLNKQ